MKVLVYIVLGLLGFFFMMAAQDLPDFGSTTSAPSQHISPYYLSYSNAETGTPNVVTAVLADYRAYDTLGETAVIFTAGLAALLLLLTPIGGGHRYQLHYQQSFGSTVLKYITTLMLPFLFLFAIYVVIHGHVSPGGGFQGGAILASGVIILRLVRGEQPDPTKTRNIYMLFASSGLLLFTVIGALSFFWQGTFLEYSALPLSSTDQTRHYFAILGVEVGIAITVMGVLVLIFNVLRTYVQK